MENRNPLEVFGKNDQSVHIEKSFVVYIKKGQKTTIPIAQITEITIYPPYAWEKSRFSISTAKTFNGGLIFRLRTEDELPYAQNIQKYIAEFQANASAASNAPPSCKLDQLARLKAFLDDGTISEEEFSALKKELIEQ